MKECKCSVCHVFRRSNWCALDGDELASLSSGLAPREYRKGAVIYSMGQPNRGVYCISGGCVAVRKIDAIGNSVLLDLGYPGDTLGYRSFLVGGEHKTTADALAPTHICHVRPDAVSRLLERNPSLGLQFLRRATGELERAHEAIFHVGTLSARQRFAHLLLVLSRRHGEQRSDGSRHIELPISRGDLASMIGARHETLSRIIGRLEADGVATFSGRHVHVPRLDALVKELEPA